MNHDAFDDKMMELLNDFDLKDEKLHRYSPFYHVITLLTLGFTMVLFTFHFAYFNLLLPLLGRIFLCFGFYIIHKENRHFLYAYYSSLLLFVLTSISGILEAASYQLHPTNNFYLILILLETFMLLHYTIGLQKSFKKKTPSIRGTFISYLLLKLSAILAGFTTIQPSVASFLYVVFYCFMFYFLIKTQNTLFQDGYQFNVVKIRHSLYSGTFIAYVLICSMVFGTLYYTTHHEAAPFKERISMEKVEHNNNLILKGMDESIAYSIDQQDLAELQKVEHFVSETAVLGLESSDQVKMQYVFGYRSDNQIELILYYQIIDHKSSLRRQIAYRYDTEYIKPDIELVSSVHLYDNENRVYISNDDTSMLNVSEGSNHRGYRRYTLQLEGRQEVVFSMMYLSAPWYKYPYQVLENPYEYDQIIPSSEYTFIGSDKKAYRFNIKIGKDVYLRLINNEHNN